MINPWRFLLKFLSLLAAAGWVLGILAVLFTALALILAWSESPRLDFWQSIYLSAITALTIGYGDIAPMTVTGRLVAVGLGFLGIVLTGVVVAAAIKAMEKSSER